MEKQQKGWENISASNYLLPLGSKESNSQPHPTHLLFPGMNQSLKTRPMLLLLLLQNGGLSGFSGKESDTNNKKRRSPGKAAPHTACSHQSYTPGSGTR